MTKTIQVRQLKSGRWVCEVVRNYPGFLWKKPRTTVHGLSSLLKEYAVSSNRYALYCVGDEHYAKLIYRDYNDKSGV